MVSIRSTCKLAPNIRVYESEPIPEYLQCNLKQFIKVQTNVFLFLVHLAISEKL